MIFEFLFWGALGTLVYVYFGFILILFLASKIKGRPVVKKDILPSVSIIISAHNEEKQSDLRTWPVQCLGRCAQEAKRCNCATCVREQKIAISFLAPFFLEIIELAPPSIDVIQQGFPRSRIDLGELGHGASR